MMNEAQRTRLSKFLCLVLRHRPQLVGITLDPGGWVLVEQLRQACATKNRQFTIAELEQVISHCPKQRLSLSECGQRIRANQGHSIPVDLGYLPTEPPDVLYHGTAQSRVAAIQREGLRRMRRHHVHLSEALDTATRVGSRHGTPVVFLVHAAAMHQAGHEFFVSNNRVWLTDHVPPEYLAPVP